MASSWERVFAELERRGKDQQWLADALGYSAQRVSNWRARGEIPKKEHANVAVAMGETVDWVAGMAPPRRKDPERLSPMGVKIAQEFDAIADGKRQLDAFAAIIAVITRARET